MISSSQLTLSQSKTTMAKTPPPTQATTETKTTRKTVNNNRQTQEEQQQQEQQQKQDDLVINDNDDMNENDINIIVPSFIRLFVLRRIIDKYIKNNKHKKTTKEIIKDMANVFKEDKHIESLVINIVTRLIQYGIKKYMSKHYNEKTESNIIENIFCKIILEEFKIEYTEMIKYGINNESTNDNYYQNLLFNSRDLMNEIFQYLKWGILFDEDLYSCSLVSSHWLYHVWNANSVYYIDFFELVRVDNSENNRKWTRMWQRLCNVKSVRLDFNVKYSKAALCTVNKLSTFRKIEKVDVDVSGENEVEKCISAMIAIMSRCKDRIKYCRIRIYFRAKNSSDFEAPSPLRLPQAQYVEIGDLVFYRIWTNKCTQLKLSCVNNISKDWCKFVIENCDCSNITNLVLNSVTFDDNSINEVILKQFGSKFYNLKTLKIVFNKKVYNNVSLFWQLLKPIISKNKTKVQLKVEDLKHKKAIVLSKRMDQKDLQIDKLIIGSMTSYDDDVFDGAIKLIQERDDRGLNHLTIEHEMSGSQRRKLLDELKCKSITTFEVQNYNIDFVNSLLEWKMIAQKQIFVIIDVYKDHSNYNNGDSDLSLFKKLYDNVHQLFVQQIALDVKIKLENVKDSKVFDSYLSLYSSFFENCQFLSKYNSPKCNSNLCLPRIKPYTYFYIHDSKKYSQRYFVFGATNVQMKSNNL